MDLVNRPVTDIVCPNSESGKGHDLSFRGTAEGREPGIQKQAVCYRYWIPGLAP